MRVLLVCRHFPPAISGGARRPFLLSRELARRGHEVLVAAPQPCEGVRVTVVPHVQVDPPPAASEARPGLRDRLRESLLVPDPDLRWALRVARVPLPWSPDWVVTTSPPESSHVAGRLLQRRLGCRWLADFRDHWIRHPLRAVLLRSGTRRGVERALARRLLGSADAVTATTPAILDEIRGYGAPLAAAVVENFADPPGRRARLEPGPLHLVHTGGFLLSDRGRPIEPLLAAFEAAGRPDLRLHLVGRLRADEVERVARSPAADRITVTGPLPLDETRAYQAAADVLLLIAGATQLPGKLAEYRASGRPILVHGDGPWAAIAGLSPVADLAQALRTLPESAVLPPPGLGVAEAADRFEGLMAAPAA